MNYNRPNQLGDKWIFAGAACAFLIGLWMVIVAFTIHPTNRINGYIIDIPKEMIYNGNYYCHKMGDTLTVEPLMYSEYQVSYGEKDSLVIYDGERLIATIPNTHSLMDSVLAVDNDAIPGIVWNEYHDGDILLPDYVHTDTLIVINAKLINKAYTERKPTTDQEISNVLSLGTKHYIRQSFWFFQREQPINQL